MHVSPGKTQARQRSNTQTFTVQPDISIDSMVLNLDEQKVFSQVIYIQVDHNYLG